MLIKHFRLSWHSINSYVYFFIDVKLLAESLPRRNSSLLLVRLGGLFLRDLATEGTMFPLLVFPNPVCTAGGGGESIWVMVMQVCFRQAIININLIHFDI